jgi:hypothetical protein
MDHKQAGAFPSRGSFDVVVAGAGPAGVCAGLAAAREGAKVLLIERTHQAGGMGTSGLVSHWLGGRSTDTRRWATGGLFRRFCEETAGSGVSVLPRAEGFAGRRYTPYGQYPGSLLAGVPFDPFLMAPYLEKQLADAGVHTLFQVQVVDTVCESGRIRSLVLAGKEGLGTVDGRYFIDATGDADLAARAGAPHVLGAEKDGYMTPVSLIIHLEGVDEGALMAYIENEDDPRFRKMLARLRDAGVDTYGYEILIFVKLNRDGLFMVNGRKTDGIDGTKDVSRTSGFIRERARIPGTLEIFRRSIPGMENARLKAVASDLGVRETRRITSDFRLTVSHVVSGSDFPDTIGFSAYGWDLHPSPGEKPVDGHNTPKPELTAIPFRIMVPQGVTNLLCPGRAASLERHVLGPLRVMAPVMAMGEAAGCATGLSLKNGAELGALAMPALRERLRIHGALVDREAVS